MSPRRSRLELYLDVLRLINDDVKTPNEMTDALGIPPSQMHHIMISVVSQGLVRELDQGSDQPGVCYEITQKGENVLRYFSQVEGIEEISNVARAH